MLPFTVLLSPAILPEELDMGSFLFPAITGILAGGINIIIYPGIILLYTIVVMLFFVSLEKSNDRANLINIKNDERLEKIADEEILKRIRNLNQKL